MGLCGTGIAGHSEEIWQNKTELNGLFWPAKASRSDTQSSALLARTDTR